MKRIIGLCVFLSFTILILGCQNTKTKATEGAVVGGVLGAGAGGIIGHQMGRGAEGAGIGAAVGAIAGGLIGGQIEKKPAQDTSASATTTQVQDNTQMSILQVIELSRQGTSDNAIIDKIKKTNSKFNLTNEDMVYLKNHGVSQKVIDAMKGN